MFDNVPKRFIPDRKYLPDLIFAHPLINYVNFKTKLNACEMILEEGLDETRRNKIAVIEVDKNEKYKYSYLELSVNRFASGLLKIGVRPGDRILWCLGERVESIICQLAIWKIGAISVPSSLTERSRELRYMVEDTEAALVITQKEQLIEMKKSIENINSVKYLILIDEKSEDREHHDSKIVYWDELMDQNVVQIDSYSNAPFDVASIYYTGGTTGRPKGCIQTHAAEVAIADLNSKLIRKITPDDMMFSHAPIGHAFGNCEKINHPLRSGCTTILMNQPKPENIWNVFIDYKVTIMAGAPTMYHMLINKMPTFVNRQQLNLRICFSSGEFLSDMLYEKWLQLTGIPLNNAVGTSPMRQAFIDSMYDGVKIGPDTSVGRPIPGFEIKLINEEKGSVGIDEIGRLAVRGPTGIAYWTNKHPDIEKKLMEDTLNGWSLIDDAFTFSEKGWLYFKTRLDNMIVSAGRQIAATEVEEVISQHKDVLRVAVVGIPDEERGHIVKAFIQLKFDKKGTDGIKEEIRQFAKQQMALYKCPKVIEFVSEIPVDNVGKIKRRQLREM